jgi:hypothetical protein
LPENSYGWHSGSQKKRSKENFGQFGGYVSKGILTSSKCTSTKDFGWDKFTILMELCERTLQEHFNSPFTEVPQRGQGVPFSWFYCMPGRGVENAGRHCQWFRVHTRKGGHATRFTVPKCQVALNASELTDSFVFETSRVWKIADFGLTSEATLNRAVTAQFSRGTSGYGAPELFSN